MAIVKELTQLGVLKRTRSNETISPNPMEWCEAVNLRLCGAPNSSSLKKEHRVVAVCKSKVVFVGKQPSHVITQKNWPSNEMAGGEKEEEKVAWTQQLSHEQRATPV